MRLKLIFKACTLCIFFSTKVHRVLESPCYDNRWWQRTEEDIDIQSCYWHSSLLDYLVQPLSSKYQSFLVPWEPSLYPLIQHFFCMRQCAKCQRRIKRQIRIRDKATKYCFALPAHTEDGNHRHHHGRIFQPTTHKHKSLKRLPFWYPSSSHHTTFTSVIVCRAGLIVVWVDRFLVGC